MAYKRLRFWSLTAAIILVAAYIMIKLGGGISGAGSILIDSISKSDWTLGNKDAKVILIEYSDFQCPACAMYSTVVNNLASEFGSHAVFAYRHFPLDIHQNAIPAARAAEAAGLQGEKKFWEMHDMLFNNQSKWETQQAPKEVFVEFAQNLNLDIEKFKTDYESSAVKNNIDLDAASAENNKLTYTPTFFLNGKLITNPRTYDDFRTIIRDTIQANP